MLLKCDLLMKLISMHQTNNVLNVIVDETDESVSEFTKQIALQSFSQTCFFSMI